MKKKENDRLYQTNKQAAEENTDLHSENPNIP